MNTAIYHSLNEAGIGIPFPQRDLHIVSAAPELGSLLSNGRSGPEQD
jgi:small-conductance mechanosensitive channel